MSRRVFVTLIVGMLLLLAIPLAAVAKPIVLSFAIQNSESSFSSIHCIEPWMKAVEEATNGKVKIQPYYSQTLTKAKDAWNANKLGISDISWNFHGYWPGMTPLTDVVSLPALPFETAEKGSVNIWNLYEKYPKIQKEFSDNKVLLLYTSEPYTLITRDKPVTSLEDLAGMKIRTTGGPPTAQMKALGGVPVSIPMPENYMALQKGVIDGMGAPWEAMLTFRLYEVTNYFTQVPFPATYFSVTMNKSKWNSLPKDVQVAFMSVSGAEGAKFWGKNFWDAAQKEVLAKVKASGKDAKVNKLSDEEQQRWLELGGKPIWEKWVSDMEKKGHAEAREILQTVLGQAGQ